MKIDSKLRHHIFELINTKIWLQLSGCIPFYVRSKCDDCLEDEISKEVPFLSTDECK